MRMDLLLQECGVLDVQGDPATVDVTGIELDSQRVLPGMLFCCLPGRHLDGHDFAEAAIARGATSLLVERFLPFSVPQARVMPGEARSTMAFMACAASGHPADALRTFGVTGTNGKTTVTHMLGAILDRHGWKTEVIGTLDGARTTPESPELQRRFADAKDAGCTAVAMEVSSHALVEHRVDGFTFDAAIFTNLGHDHLDEHRTIEAYFAAKASLFTPEHARLGIVNIDDQWGLRLARIAEIPLVTFSATRDASDVVLSPGKTEFTWRGVRVTTAFTGGFNVANAVAAATLAAEVGIETAEIADGLGVAHPVPGRFELVDVGGEVPFSVVVDYAHTPDGLGVALDASRVLAKDNRVLCVFGCGGDRDRAKRPAMGREASRRADLVVLTSDNSRSEDPEAIVAEIVSGLEGPAEVIVELNRRLAIEYAINAAHSGDVVLVAGKGHEVTLVAGGLTEDFDDRIEVATALGRRFGGSSSVNLHGGGVS